MRVSPAVQKTFKDLYGGRGQTVYVYALGQGDYQYYVPPGTDAAPAVHPLNRMYRLAGRLDFETGEIVSSEKKKSNWHASEMLILLLKLLVVLAKVVMIVAAAGAMIIVMCCGGRPHGHGASSRGRH